MHIECLSFLSTGKRHSSIIVNTKFAQDRKPVTSILASHKIITSCLLGKTVIAYVAIFESNSSQITNTSCKILLHDQLHLHATVSVNAAVSFVNTKISLSGMYHSCKSNVTWDYCN